MSRYTRTKSGERIPPPRCYVAGCGKATRQGKPVCSAHVLELPYAAEVAARTERVLAERETLAAGEILAGGSSVLLEDLCELLALAGGKTRVCVLTRALDVTARELRLLVAGSGGRVRIEQRAGSQRRQRSWCVLDSVR